MKTLKMAHARKEQRHGGRSDRPNAYPAPSLALLIVFATSAAAGVYGVVWTLSLARSFDTPYAAGIILAGFIAGLALGGYVFGALVDRLENHLRWYGFLQIGMGIYGLSFPLSLKLASKSYAILLPSNETHSVLFQLCLFVLSFALLSLPGLLAGATLPVFSRLVRGTSSLARWIGNLYALHTLGAFVGCMLAGFFAIPGLGVQATTYVGVGMNLTLGLSVLVLDRWGRRRTPLEEYETRSARACDTPANDPWAAWPIVSAMALSGFTALLYATGWTRVLTLVFGTSIYTSIGNLVIFLIGLSAGGFLYVRFFARKRVSLSTLAFIELGIAGAAFATVPLFEKLPLLFVRLLQGLGDSFPLSFTAQLLLTGLVMVLPTAFLGMAFPMAARLWIRTLGPVGRSVGVSYATHTGGAMLAAWAGSLLIPHLGIQNVIVLAGLCNLSVACVLLTANPGIKKYPKLFWGAAIAAMMVVVPWNMPSWDPKIFTSGVSLYSRDYATMPNDALRRELMRQPDILYYGEGPTATVSVHRDFPRTDAGHERRHFRINGRIVGSSHDHWVAQLLAGYLPLFFSPDAERAAVVGLNTGITVRAIAAFPLRQIDVLEIEPPMVGAAAFFDDSNGNVLRDPRVQAFSNGPRQHLLGAREPYHLIVATPSGSAAAVISDRYTREFYELVKTKLSSRGVFALYVDNYSIPPEDFRGVLRTFAEAFPHVSLWELGTHDFLLLGSPQALRFNYSALPEVFSQNDAIRKDLESLGLPDAYAVLGFYRLGRKEILAFTEGASIHTDGGVHLAYSLPRNLRYTTYGLNRRLMEPFVSQAPWLDSDVPIIPESLHRFYLATAFAASKAYLRALKEVDLAIASDDENAEFYVLKANLLVKLGQEIPATQAALKALELAPSSASQLIPLSADFRLREARGLLFKKIIESGARDIRPYTGMVEISLFFDSLSDAETWAERARVIQPDHPKVLEVSGRIELLKKNYTEARQLLQNAKNTGADSAMLYGSLGEAYAGMESWEQAEAAYEQALKRDLRNTRWRRSLGRVLARMGKRERAERAFRETLALDPGDAESWQALERLAGGHRIHENGRPLAYGHVGDAP